MRPVLSISWEQVFILKLLWGSKPLIEDLTLAEFGLGGSPLVEPGLDRETKGPSVFAKVDNAISSDRAGICSEDRLGRLDWGIRKALSPFSFPVHVYNAMPSKYNSELDLFVFLLWWHGVIINNYLVYPVNLNTSKTLVIFFGYKNNSNLILINW